MPLEKFSRADSLAYIQEITSTRNLLAYGIHSVENAAFNDTMRDPIFTMLSIGLEKLHKLALGTLQLERTGKWPPVKEMKALGHGIAEMHKNLMTELIGAAGASTPYVRGLLDAVHRDNVLPPVIAALDMYGQSGRFYYLNQLGALHEARQDPSGFWTDIEVEAIKEPQLAELMNRAMKDVANTATWDEFLLKLNCRIAASIRDLWTAVAVAGRNRVIGDTGVHLGWEIHPDSVGRQLIAELD